ncbi:hypothetical protein ACHHRT_09740, partial [Desulfurivibrio sp. D14AmB]|uniref:hypothetical protein n=1 Tax=Desulfurivibrio sp. D14AmB TaxID=3374370 RepID=UPI00376EDE4D
MPVTNKNGKKFFWLAGLLSSLFYDLLLKQKMDGCYFRLAVGGMKRKLQGKIRDHIDGGCE